VQAEFSSYDYDDYIREFDIEEKGVEDDVFETEIPKRLLEASEHFQKMIQRLPKDEFGDFIYHGEDHQDQPSQRLKNFGSRFQALVNRLKMERQQLQEEREKHHVTTADRKLQTDETNPGLGRQKSFHSSGGRSSFKRPMDHRNTSRDFLPTQPTVKIQRKSTSIGDTPKNKQPSFTKQ